MKFYNEKNLSIITRQYFFAFLPDRSLIKQDVLILPLTFDPEEIVVLADGHVAGQNY